MAAEITENTESNQRILAALDRIENILARIEPLIPAMERAATFLDNPVQRYRDAMRSRRDRNPGD